MPRLHPWLALVALVGCSGDPPDEITPDPNAPDPEAPLVLVDTVAGPAQKGPFLADATVSAAPLEANGQPGATAVTGTVTAEGRFDLSGLSWMAATWIEVSGQVFDEIEGEPYDDPFTLNAAVLPVEGRQAAVNLFTDLAAHRIATLMAAGATFDDAQLQAIGEMTPLWGLTDRPENLDLLGGPGSAGEELDLLLYSASAMDEGLDQDDWVDVRLDFADDGQLNGDGLDTHQDIVDNLRNNAPELLETARETLRDAYRAPPAVTEDGLGFFINGCLGRYLVRPDRTVCENLETTFEAPNGDTIALEWLPDLPGLHAVVIDQPCNVGSYAFGPTTGGLSSGSFTELLLDSRDLPSQAPIAWSFVSGCDGDAVFSVTPYRTSDGSTADPLPLRLGEAFDGRASNEFTGRDRIAHYVVAGGSEVQIFDFNSGTGLNSQ
ncbi:MAG: hypothetical protein AAF602_17020, partial [Myxococcota bacterium]